MSESATIRRQTSRKFNELVTTEDIIEGYRGMLAIANRRDMGYEVDRITKNLAEYQAHADDLRSELLALGFEPTDA